METNNVIQNVEFFESVPTEVEFNINDPLSIKISHKIQKNGGHISYGEFMEMSLRDEEHGYYIKDVNIGKTENGGDFSTLPEQYPREYGAVVAENAYQNWINLGKPNNFGICEAGSGNGKLANGILRWISENHVDFYKSVHYYCIDVSRKLLGNAKDILKNSGFENKTSFIEGDIFSKGVDLKIENGVFISNELLDTSNVELVKKMDEKLVQKYVGVENGRWVIKFGTPSLEVSKFVSDYDVVVEDKEVIVHPQVPNYFTNIKNVISKGGTLTVDYCGEAGDRLGRGKLRLFSNVLEVKNDSRSWDVQIIKANEDDRYDLFVLMNNGKEIKTLKPNIAEFAHPGKIDITTDTDPETIKKIIEKEGFTGVKAADIGQLGRESSFMIFETLSDRLKSEKRLSEKTKIWKEIEGLLSSINLHISNLTRSDYAIEAALGLSMVKSDAQKNFSYREKMDVKNSDNPGIIKAPVDLPEKSMVMLFIKRDDGSQFPCWSEPRLIHNIDNDKKGINLIPTDIGNERKYVLSKLDNLGNDKIIVDLTTKESKKKFFETAGILYDY